MTFIDPRMAPRGFQPPWWAMTNNIAQPVPQPPFPITPYNPSMMERVRGGLFPDNGMGGLLGHDALQGAQRQGLLGLGLSMLANSGRSTEQRGLGQILAQGMQGGQQAYQGALGGALQQQQLVAQMARQKAMQAIQDKYKPAPGETKAQRNNRIAEMAAEMIRLDPEMGGKLNWLAGLFKDEEPARERNIDPRSKEGIAAEKELIRYRASLEPPKEPKPLTEGQQKASTLLDIAGPSAEALDAFDAPNRIAQLAGQKGINELLNSNQQLLDVHTKVVADAYVRLTSGANAPEPEFNRAFQMIAPRPGDSAALLAEKRKIRGRFITALRNASQRGEVPRSIVKVPDAPADAGSAAARVRAAVRGSR